uniref:Uncharacterized protein n=1 Tax=viral metagenome TaxID=1070528 RepID=A0A6C0LMR7_9ZZZZ
MGVHERAKSEEREIEYAFINDCKHTGNNYGGRGDVEKNGEEIELKFLSKGKGTLANTTGDLLTKNRIFSCDSWSDYRKKNFEPEREKIISPYRKDHNNLDNIGYHIKANNPKDKKAIMKLAKEDKLGYIKYLSENKFNNERLAKLTLLLIIGFHTEESILSHIDKSFDEIKELKKGYEIIYKYPDGKEVKEDLDKIIKEAQDINKFSIDYKKCKQQNIEILYDSKKILKLAFHWKNIFQGIKTPCLNVFLMK